MDDIVFVIVSTLINNNNDIFGKKKPLLCILLRLNWLFINVSPDQIGWERKTAECGGGEKDAIDSSTFWSWKCKGQNPMSSSSTSVQDGVRGIRFTFLKQQKRQAIWNNGFHVTGLYVSLVIPEKWERNKMSCANIQIYVLRQFTGVVKRMQN